MKRKIAALAMAVCLGTVMMTGCGSKKAGVEVDASRNEDLSAEVTAENTVDNNEEAYQKFLDAQIAMEGVDSITINSDMLINMTYDGKSDESNQHFDISRSLIDGAQVVDFVMKNEVKSTDEDGNVDEDNSYSQETPGYFIGDELYFIQSVSDDSSEDVKLKESMTYEELMSIIGSTYILNDISADLIATSAAEEKDGGVKYIYILDNDAMSEYMMYNLANSGVTFAEEGGVVINYADVSADINADGILTAYTFSVDAVVSDVTGEVPFSYKIASAFTGINSTNVKVRTESELADYISTEDYAAQIEEEQAAAGSIPSEEEAADGTIELTPENAAEYGIELVDELPEEAGTAGEAAPAAE